MHNVYFLSFVHWVALFLIVVLLSPFLKLVCTASHLTCSVECAFTCVEDGNGWKGYVSTKTGSRWQLSARMRSLLTLKFHQSLANNNIVKTIINNPPITLHTISTTCCWCTLCKYQSFITVLFTSQHPLSQHTSLTEAKWRKIVDMFWQVYGTPLLVMHYFWCAVEPSNNVYEILLFDIRENIQHKRKVVLLLDNKIDKNSTQ